MTILDTIQTRLADLDIELARLDATFTAERTRLQARRDTLLAATKLVTPDIQAVVDKLGLVLSGM